MDRTLLDVYGSGAVILAQPLLATAFRPIAVSAFRLTSTLIICAVSLPAYAAKSL